MHNRKVFEHSNLWLPINHSRHPVNKREAVVQHGAPACLTKPRFHRSEFWQNRSVIALCCTSRHLRLSQSELLCLWSRRCSRDLAATLRSRLRSKISQGTKCPLPGSSCHAAIGARTVPWQQPGDWAVVIHPFAFTALSAPIPTCAGVARH
jgi:hypothetical protein